MQNRFIVILLLFFICGCKKDVVLDPVTLSGKWQIKSYNQTIHKNGTLVSSVTSGPDDFNTRDIIIFNTDGTGSASSSRTELAYFKSSFNFEYNHPEIKLIQYSAGGNTTITTKYVIDKMDNRFLDLHTSSVYNNEGEEYIKTEKVTLFRPGKGLDENGNY